MPADVLSLVAPGLRHHRYPLAAVAAAGLLLSGCSADRLSERMTYRADTVTSAVPAPVAAVTTTATTVAAPARVAAAAPKGVRAHPAAPAPVPAPATTPAPAPVPAPAAAPASPRHHVSPRRATTTRSGPPPAPAAAPSAPSADAAARAAVLAFHRLLDERDPGACDLLTAAFARASFGGDTDAAFAQCRASVQAITVPVRARITGSGRERGGRTVDVVSHVGAVIRRQTMHLVFRDGEWLIDSAQPDGG